MAYQAGVIFEGRGFNFDVVDQFGTGDAFFAGLLYALSEDRQLPYALDFGNALCALAHTVEGDPAIFSPEEVEAVLEEGYSLVTRR
jgi:2-dehydro-3-deoxygluconokinase